MKTAEEYVKDIHGYDLDDDTTQILMKSYRDYAKQVAEQALIDASTTLSETYTVFDFEGEDITSEAECIIKQTIIQLP